MRFWSCLLLFVLIDFGCGSNISLDMQNQSSLILGEDIVSPEISDLDLVASDIFNNSVKITWKAAVDDKTFADQLKYVMAYTTEEPEINLSIDSVLKNWKVFGSPKADDTSITVDGLSQDTLYYFVVIVSDKTGNSSIYSVVSQQTSSMEDIKEVVQEKQKEENVNSEDNDNV